jgi:hypothetical protein
MSSVELLAEDRSGTKPATQFSFGEDRQPVALGVWWVNATRPDRFGLLRRSSLLSGPAGERPGHGG